MATLLGENSHMGTLERSRCGMNGVEDEKELKLFGVRVTSKGLNERQITFGAQTSNRMRR